MSPCEVDEDGRCSVHGDARWRCAPFRTAGPDDDDTDDGWTWDGG